MGAAACSDAKRLSGAETLDRNEDSRGYLKGTNTISSSSGGPRGASYWHDKMKMSAASQAIFEGAQRGDVRQVLNALNAHGDPNCVNFGGYTALMMAVGGGYKEVVALLLQASSDPNYHLRGVTPLMIAAASGQLDILRMLVNCGAATAVADHETGRSALHRACIRGHADAAKLLIQSGAAIDIDDASGCTPLMLAAQAGHADVVRILLCAGASVSIADRKGESALTKCIGEGHDACLDAMLKAGAPVNAVNRSTGDTALIAASRVGSEFMCRKLLQFQANVNLANQHRQTPILLAAQGGHDKVVRQLLVAGSDTTFQDLMGYNALMHGAVGGNALVVTTMLDFGAPHSMVNQLDGSTALTVAAAHGNFEAYNVLAKAGAVVSAIEGTSSKGCAVDGSPSGHARAGA